MGALARLHSLVRGLFRRSDIESEMREEFEHHIELRAADLEREGLSPEEARRRAHREFGHAEGHREAARASRGLRIFDELRFSWVDVKLGIRMLCKNPGLTLAAVFALAVGIPVGMLPIHFESVLTRPLPEDDGDRIRAIHYWSTERNVTEWPTRYELDRWEEELAGFERIGAVRPEQYALADDAGGAPPFWGAQATASTFDILGTPPLLGRTLNRADESPGAPDVAVMGYDLWQSRFGGDPDIVGRTIRLRGTAHTVIGVMPQGFYFPRNEHLWIPLRAELLTEPGQGPAIQLFGRLAPGVSPRSAQAEVSAAGQRLAREFPESNQRLNAEVLPWGLAAWGMPAGGLRAMPGMFIVYLLCFVLLLVACANVAMLIFARSATRFRELAIRSALGAGRLRIVSQMFVESLVLAVGSAALGLIGLSWALRRLQGWILQQDQADATYWVDLGITADAVGWALLFALISAVVVSVGPALKVTGRRIQENIQRAGAGRSGIRFGGITGALIVADVAIVVTAVGFGIGLWDRVRDSGRDTAQVGIEADEFLRTALTLPVDNSGPVPGVDAFDTEIESAAFAARVGEIQRTLVERLEAEPWVRGVGVASELPRMGHQSARVEVEGETAFQDLDFLETLGRWPAVVQADIGYFDGLEQPILAGRGFNEADLEGEISTVIVNTTFVERTLGGRNPLGRRIRFPDLAGGSGTPDGRLSPTLGQVSAGTDPRWLEIVGVVGRLGTNVGLPEYDMAAYLPAAPGDIYPVALAIHVAGGEPESFAPRIRELVSEVAPAAVLAQPIRLDRVFPGNYMLFLVTTSGLAALVLILMAMATSGLYAILSFAVSERTREIAIRTALGASSASIVGRIANRSLGQVAFGAVLGMPLAGWLFQLAESGADSTGVSFGVAVATGIGVVVLIGVASGLSPIRRALGIRPIEALRSVE